MIKKNLTHQAWNSELRKYIVEDLKERYSVEVDIENNTPPVGLLVEEESATAVQIRYFDNKGYTVMHKPYKAKF